ncbi:MAG: hypothetical protein ACE5EA_09625, partial [Nitrospirota bacterium]
ADSQIPDSITRDSELTPAPGKVLTSDINGLAIWQSPIPSGVIVMWLGSITDIPEGWALCDGTNGTPDLRNRFIVGAGDAYGVGDTGGSISHDHGGATGDHTLTIDEMPPHRHTFGMHNWDEDGVVMPDRSGAAQRQASPATDPTGGGQPHNHPIASSDHRPPYYALAYIIKL